MEFYEGVFSFCRIKESVKSLKEQVDSLTLRVQK